MAVDTGRPIVAREPDDRDQKRIAPQISVVMMTSTASSAVINRAQATGALAFLKKPFYPADIDTVIERHYGLHTAAH